MTVNHMRLDAIEEEEMKTTVTHEAELYFERGGPANRIVSQLVQKVHPGHSVRLRILAFLAITWLPIFLLALIEGRAWGTVEHEYLLFDFGTYARFFLGVPLLIVAESVVGPRLRAAGLQFLQGGFVRPDQYKDFDRAIQGAAKMRESAWAELAIVLVALTGSWFFNAETIAGDQIATWRSTDTGSSLSITACWHRLIALPILQFFWYRWIWRILCWARFLWTVSRLDLRLVGTHADLAGGLGFLGTAQLSLGIFAFALSTVLSAEAAYLIVFRSATIETFQTQLIVLVVVMELILLGPLFTFTPALIRSRLAALHDYSLLLSRYNFAFHKKWILEDPPTDEALLGSGDIQSLADLGTSFERVRDMRIVPFSMRTVIQLAIVTCLPFTPLILLVMPVSEILDLLSKAAF